MTHTPSSALADVLDANTEGSRVAPATVVITGSLDGRSRPDGLTSLSERLHVRWSPSGRTTASDSRGTVSLDGVAVVERRLLRTAGELMEVWDGRDAGDFAQWWGARARQSACAYVWHAASRRLVVLPDPIGGATVFVHEVDGVCVLSSDYGALISTLTELGLRPTKDLMYQVERTVVGSGGLWETSYTGGRRVPTFTHVVVDAAGLREVRYAAAPSLTEPLSYFDGLSTVRSDVLASVEAIAAAPTDERVAHLTGGFDSRLVLGAILETGLQDRFDFFCSGPPESPDRAVADGLARTFGLTRAHSGGLMPVVVGSFVEQQQALLSYTAGLSNVGPTGLEPQRDIVAAGGGYGELLRSFYTHAITGQGNAPWEDGRGLLTAMLGSAPDEGILTAHAFGLIASRLSEVLTGIHGTGVPADFVGDVFYSDVRNRYHMGATTLYWSRVGARVNPLYTVAALPAARELTGLARRANVLGYDLLESFGRSLSQYPFDTDRSSPEYRRQRRARRGIPFGDGPLRWAPRRPSTAAPGPEITPERRELVLARAKAVNLIYWQSLHLESTQSAFGHVLEQVDLSDYTEVVNLSYLQELARTTSWTRGKVRHLYAASAMLTWYAEDAAR